MPRVPFDELPDPGRLWVFPASRELSEEERSALLAEVDAFLEEWAAHGKPLSSGRDLLEGRFLVVGVDEDASRPSGCSIDALTNRLRVLGERMGVTLIEHGPVWFRADGRVRSEPRSAFRARVKEGSVDLRTPVFDTTLTRIGELRAGALERPAGESWHGRAFFGLGAPS